MTDIPGFSTVTKQGVAAGVVVVVGLAASAGWSLLPSGSPRAWSAGPPILIESAESRTREDGPVYNRIRWFSSRTRDVWMMQQSHSGVHAAPGQWDRLAIVVDKTATPMTARFVQIEPGSLEWPEKGMAAFGMRRVPNRASCFLCHANGPRAIRPNLDSEAVPVSAGDRFRVAAWNFRIKTYGRIVADAEHEREDPGLKVPFRVGGKLENEHLAVKTCQKCHHSAPGGWFSREPLTRQHATTIQFMVSGGHMPPPGFGLSEEEKARLEAFVAGF